jgi:hypothetical protein
LPSPSPTAKNYRPAGRGDSAAERPPLTCVIELNNAAVMPDRSGSMETDCNTFRLFIDPPKVTVE